MPRGVDAGDHLHWCEHAVARPVARKYRLRGQEADDVVQAALLKLLELVAADKFDVSRVPPDGDVGKAFQGWAIRWVRCEAVREALRIRGGGLFRTARAENVVVADPLGDAAGSVRADDEPGETPDVVAGNLLVDLKPSCYGRQFRWPKRGE